MRASGGKAAGQIALLCTFEGLASACPFCGGKGANGLLETLLLVALSGSAAAPSCPR